MQAQSGDGEACYWADCEQTRHLRRACPVKWKGESCSADIIRNCRVSAPGKRLRDKLLRSIDKDVVKSPTDWEATTGTIDSPFNWIRNGQARRVCPRTPTRRSKRVDVFGGAIGELAAMAEQRNRQAGNLERRI